MGLGQKPLPVRASRPSRGAAAPAQQGHAAARVRVRRQYWRHPLRNLPGIARAGGPPFLVFGERGQGVAKALMQRRAVHGRQVFAWSLSEGPSYDLSSPLVLGRVRGWLQSGLLAGVWIDLPASLAGPDAPPSSVAVLRAARVLVGVALRRGVPAGVLLLERAFGSARILSAAAARQGSVHVVRVGLCQHGSPARMRSRLVGVHLDLAGLGLTCTGRHGVCSATGRQHSSSGHVCIPFDLALSVAARLEAAVASLASAYLHDVILRRSQVDLR